MKKLVSRLFIISLSSVALSGCDFFSSIFEEPKVEDSIELRDYSQSVLQDEKYTYDGKVFLIYEDKSETEVTDKCEYDYTTLDTSTAGNGSYFTVKFEGEQFVFKKKAYITVNKKVSLVDINVSNYSTFCKLNTTYTFDGTVIASFDDGTTKNVTTEIKVDTSALNTSVEGNYKVKVSYTEGKITASKELSIKVAEHAGVLTKIAASNFTKTVDKGETYVFDGIVTATYSDGTTEVVTDRCEIGSISTSTSGNKSLPISFTDTFNKITKTTNLTIEVIAHVESLEGDSTLDVAVNRTKALSISVKPSDAKNKDLTYVSADPDIASVDANGKVTGGNTANTHTTITITSKDVPSITKTVTVNVVEQQLDAWTIMIYLCGANLESEGSLGSEDIMEILSINNQPSDVNVIIETGGSQSWHLSSSYIVDATSIPSNYLGRWHVENKKLVKDEFITNADMSAKETYQSFLEWGLTEYPADNVGVILWNHGAGLEGVCLDEKMNDGYHGLLNSETKAAHSAVITDKLTFIGYDACLMQNMEIADFNAPYFKYQVASQESENGEGWYYTGWIDNLYNKDSVETILSQICTTFVSHEGSDQTLSYLDLSYASEFKTAFENYATALKSAFASNSVSGSSFASWARSKIKIFGESNAMGYGQFDLLDWINKCQGQNSYKVNTSIASAVTDILPNYIAQNSKGPYAGQSNGLSLNYRCLSSLRYSSNESSFTNWGSFNSSYHA